MYPVMQAADVFFLDVDICSLGMDQKKVNMLCREYCNKIHRKHKPIIISHHMLMGLDGSDKMSKSNPDNAIFMNDAPYNVKRKIKKAFCEVGNIDINPILEYVKYIIFEKDDEFIIEREEKCGGNKTYTRYDDVEEDFEKKLIHSADLKNAVIECLNRYLEPVRDHFATNNEANLLHKTVKSYKINK
jgi:tyrosyl-tRNA synthetase